MNEDNPLYASMDETRLISMIHFLEKRDEEQKQENQELEELVKILVSRCKKLDQQINEEK